jgi:hypothetical protein
MRIFHVRDADLSNACCTPHIYASSMPIEPMSPNMDPKTDRTVSGTSNAGTSSAGNPTASWRTGRWVTLIYVVVALGAPLLVYAGPDVMSPTAPLIADKALDGKLTMRIHTLHANASAAANLRR